MAVHWQQDRFVIDYRPDGRWGRRLRLKLPPEVTDRAEAEQYEHDLKVLSRARIAQDQ